VGVVEGYEYEELYATLAKDVTIFIYTDGLYETENYRHETFGMKRMMARLTKSAETNEPPQKIIDRMANAVEEFRGDTKRIDDAVMVAIRAI
jgi:sigma-B regulation protein RsbU (phosphoserine phosphatase)